MGIRKMIFSLGKESFFWLNYILTDKSVESGAFEDNLQVWRSEIA